MPGRSSPKSGREIDLAGGFASARRPGMGAWSAVLGQGLEPPGQDFVVSLHGWPIPSTLARENAYPPVRVQAKNAAGTVLPISGEVRSTKLQTTNADCTGVQFVIDGTEIPTHVLKAVGAVVATRLDDADNMLPPMVVLEYRDGQGLCVELVLRSCGFTILALPRFPNTRTLPQSPVWAIQLDSEICDRCHISARRPLSLRNS